MEVRVALAMALQQEMVQVTLCELSIGSVENLKKIMGRAGRGSVWLSSSLTFPDG